MQAEVLLRITGSAATVDLCLASLWKTRPTLCLRNPKGAGILNREMRDMTYEPMIVREKVMTVRTHDRMVRVKWVPYASFLFAPRLSFASLTNVTPSIPNSQISSVECTTK
jgi:hypothetical protein